MNNPIEIEASFLDINTTEFKTKLKTLGAKLIQKETLMKRKVFDFPDHRLEKIGAWVRVRDEGNKITLSFKQLKERTLHGTTDTTIAISDFNSASQILLAIGLIQISYQETKRETWQLNNCEITIDTWPWIPTFTEIEGPTEDLVKNTTKQLDLIWDQALFGSVENIYQTYYRVTEAEVNAWPEITFIPVPEWLETKRK